MSKKDAELRIEFSDAGGRTRVATLVLTGFDLYTVVHFMPLSGKHSYHESGLAHTSLDLLEKHIRSGKRGVSLREVKGFEHITAFGAGRAPQLGNDPVRADTSTKKTLSLAPPEHPWALDVWAIESGNDAVVERICTTPPWPRSEIAGTLVSSWTAPMVLVTVWKGIDGSPYDVVHYEPPVEGEVPYLLIPEKWAGDMACREEGAQSLARGSSRATPSRAGTPLVTSLC